MKSMNNRKEYILAELEQIAGKENVLTDEPMKNHTTFRIGGPADYYVMPANAKQIAEIMKVCRRENISYYIIGNGSNLLVGDGGIRGVVIQIYKNYNRIQAEGMRMKVQAGAMLSAVSRRAQEAELTGLEFASGIPGTIGGAAVMNAGAYGGEMKDVIAAADVLTSEGEIITIPVEDMKLGYRTSIFKEKEYIVLDVVLELKKGNGEQIRAKMTELKERRVSKQPLEYPSAGSTFKRPEGYFAGKLIQDAGLRGYRVGNAQVAEKHCGFVINRGDATAEEVMQLIRDVQRKVKEEFQVDLETEVKFMGEF